MTGDAGFALELVALRPGRILFELRRGLLRSRWPGHRPGEVVVLDYDADSCVPVLERVWGIESRIRQAVDPGLPGTYVLEGVAGEYRCGDGWTTEDDEEYWFALCRRASRAEEEAGTLDGE